MRPRLASLFCAAILCGSLAFAPPALAQASAEAPAATSLRRIVPTEAHLAVAWQRNPEQEYQREHLKAVIETFKKERIAERIFEIVKERIGEDGLAEAREGFDRFQQAVAPASLEAIFEAEEICYCQIQKGQMANHLFAVRMNPDAVKGYLQAFRNLLDIAEEEAGDDISIAQEEVDGATYLTLFPPAEVPMQPTVVVVDDVLLVSTTKEMAENAVANLNANSTNSKFDQPRVAKALAQLPEAEDTIVVYDAKQNFEGVRAQLEPLMEAMEIQAGDDPQARAAARLMQVFLKEVDVVDLEVTVGYTEDGQNHTESYGTMQPGTEGRLLRNIVEGGKPFENWSRWVPANAVNYRLNSGINLHELYTGILGTLSTEAPEIAAEALMKLAELEEQVGLNLEDDLLALFSGETVSVTLPGDQSVLALACTDADHTKELLHRAVEALKQIPQVQAQQLELVPNETLEGFEDLRASFFAVLGARPVIGFKDGWMVFASTPEAAQALIDTRWGDAPDVSTTDGFARFGVEIDGPVSGVSYANTSENIRRAAQFINQAAAMAPLFVGAAMAEAEPEDQKAVQKAIGLLPSIARVIEKLDFMEAQLGVVQPKSEDGSYRKHNVVLIRQD